MMPAGTDPELSLWRESDLFYCFFYVGNFLPQLLAINKYCIESPYMKIDFGVIADSYPHTNHLMYPCIH